MNGFIVLTGFPNRLCAPLFGAGMSGSEGSAGPPAAGSSDAGSQSTSADVPAPPATVATVMRGFFDSVSRGVNLDSASQERAWAHMVTLEDKFKTYAQDVTVRCREGAKI